jgi:hypothetical protein
LPVVVVVVVWDPLGVVEVGWKSLAMVVVVWDWLVVAVVVLELLVVVVVVWDRLLVKEGVDEVREGSRKGVRVYDCSYTRSANLESQKKKS